jgi:predicted RNase H-like HicB family nuclease
MVLRIEFEQEADGRWRTEVPSLPGVMTYGHTQTDPGARVQAMALRVLAEPWRTGGGS